MLLYPSTTTKILLHTIKNTIKSTRVIKYWGDSEWSPRVTSKLSNHDNFLVSKANSSDVANCRYKHSDRHFHLLEYLVRDDNDVCWNNVNFKRAMDLNLGKRSLGLLLYNNKSPKHILEKAMHDICFPDFGFYSVNIEHGITQEKMNELAKFIDSVYDL